MADDLIMMELSENGQRCVAAVQEVFAKFDLSAADGVMAAGEIFAWTHILGFMPIGKQKVLEQMDRSSAMSRKWAEAHFDGFKASLEVWIALNSGESGGRLQ